MGSVQSDRDDFGRPIVQLTLVGVGVGASLVTCVCAAWPMASETGKPFLSLLRVVDVWWLVEC